MTTFNEAESLFIFVSVLPTFVHSAHYSIFFHFRLRIPLKNRGQELFPEFIPPHEIFRALYSLLQQISFPSTTLSSHWPFIEMHKLRQMLLLFQGVFLNFTIKYKMMSKETRKTQWLSWPSPGLIWLSVSSLS